MAHDATTTSEEEKPPRESRCEVAGWRFTTRHGDAMSSSARAALAHGKLGLGTRVPLPEMVFAQSGLTVEYAAQRVRLTFGSVPALAKWAHAHDSRTHWDHTNFDFTYCSNYHGMVERYAQEEDSSTVEDVTAVATSERLPLEKLMQHVEILFYDRVVLFEDDVRDLGEIYLEVKTRVMGFGFLVLCRYYCRIDGKSVRLMDTRYYHEFGQGFIWRDHEIREASVAELHPLLSAHGSGHANYAADAVYAVLSPTSTVTEKLVF